MQIPVIFRQGDILFKKIEKIEWRWNDLLNTDIILMGEATGHAHRAVNAELWGRETPRFIIANDHTKIIHDEHHTINLPAGMYQIIRQREYGHFEIRDVQD
jgi:hypothetical protein